MCVLIQDWYWKVGGEKGIVWGVSQWMGSEC